MIRFGLVTTRDEERWRSALPAGARVMGSLEYARICEKQTGYGARLFVAEWEGGRIAYPFLLRPIETLAFAGAAGRRRWDSITPEYTGPMCLGAAPPAGGKLVETFADYCREQGIVAEFAHLSPWHVAGEMLEPEFVENDREIVYVDLSAGEEEIWNKSFHTDCRRHVRQAEKAGVVVRRAATVEDVLEFHRLYEHTMERRDALERYRFPADYFLEFFRALPENAFFLLAEYKGQAVAGGLYLHDATDLYWHLSATDKAFSRIRAVNAYQWEAIKWGARSGRKRMLLGGGYEPMDGVFRFKASFSPLRAQFRTYRRIHDRERYAALVEAWATHHRVQLPSGGYFPAYRTEPHEPAHEATLGSAALS